MEKLLSPSGVFALSLLTFIWSAMNLSLAHAEDDKLPNSAITFGSPSTEPSSVHWYGGIEPGVGLSSGTQYPMNSGFAYGIKVGIEEKKAYGFALSYQHESMSFSGTDVSSTVNQILAEANVFSLLVLNGGFHAGDVIRLDSDGVRRSSVGTGVHIGIDVSINPHLTVGVVGYETFVLEPDDNHSLLSLLVPLKVWF